MLFYLDSNRLTRVNLLLLVLKSRPIETYFLFSFLS